MSDTPALAASGLGKSGPGARAAAPPPASAWPAVPGAPTAAWRRQLAAIVRLELRKTFPVRTLLALLVLALAPIGVLALRLLAMIIQRQPNSIGDGTLHYAQLFQTFSLRFVLCLGSAAIFGNLIRREQLDRTLHFYLLSPVRRELLVAGKYLAALVVAVLMLGASTFASFLLAYAPFDSGDFAGFLLRGPGLAHLAAYLLATVLACAAYGAVFLGFGLYLKNPVLPALLVLLWEGIHAFLPAALQRMTIVHYLQALCPLPSSAGLFGVLTTRPSPWLAVPVLLAIAAAALALSARRIRHLQIQYELD